MKKILFSIITVGLMSINAFAVDGTITKILVQSTNTIVVTVTDAGGVEKVQKLVGTTEAIKSMMATVLVAKSTASNVTLTAGISDNGSGWNNVTLN